MGHQTRQEQAWHVRLVIGCADEKDSWICVEIEGRRERCVGHARLVSWSYVAPGSSVTSSASRRSSRSVASAASCIVPFSTPRFSGFSPCYVHTSSVPHRVITCADPHAATPAFVLQHLQVLSLFDLIMCTHSSPNRARVLFTAQSLYLAVQKCYLTAHAASSAPPFSACTCSSSSSGDVHRPSA